MPKCWFLTRFSKWLRLLCKVSQLHRSHARKLILAQSNQKSERRLRDLLARAFTQSLQVKTLKSPRNKGRSRLWNSSFRYSKIRKIKNNNWRRKLNRTILLCTISLLFRSGFLFPCRIVKSPTREECTLGGRICLCRHQTWLNSLIYQRLRVETSWYSLLRSCVLSEDSDINCLWPHIRNQNRSKCFFCARDLRNLPLGAKIRQLQECVPFSCNLRGSHKSMRVEWSGLLNVQPQAVKRNNLI